MVMPGLELLTPREPMTEAECKELQAALEKLLAGTTRSKVRFIPDDGRTIACRIAAEMGIRTRKRSTTDILSDIERYIQCARYARVHNPTGKLTPWP